MCGAEDCLRVGTALAQSLPAHVSDSLSATDLLRPQSLMQAGPQAIAHLDSTLRFVDQTVPGLRDLQKVYTLFLLVIFCQSAHLSRGLEPADLLHAHL